jgi:hypothetical protein
MLRLNQLRPGRTFIGRIAVPVNVEQAPAISFLVVLPEAPWGEAVVVHHVRPPRLEQEIDINTARCVTAAKGYVPGHSASP